MAKLRASAFIRKILGRGKLNKAVPLEGPTAQVPPLERQETERQETERQETERQETERRETERQEIERRKTERQVIDIQGQQLPAESQETEGRDPDIQPQNRTAESRKPERQEPSVQDQLQSAETCMEEVEEVEEVEAGVPEHLHPTKTQNTESHDANDRHQIQRPQGQQPERNNGPGIQDQIQTPQLQAPGSQKPAFQDRPQPPSRKERERQKAPRNQDQINSPPQGQGPERYELSVRDRVQRPHKQEAESHEPGGQNIVPQRVIPKTLKEQVPNGKPPPQSPRNLFALPPELLLYIAEEFLNCVDGTSTILLSLTCRKFYAIFPRHNHLLFQHEKLEICKAFPPRYERLQHHPHPYLCIDCYKWHSIKRTALWPDWAPEKTFQTFDDFADPRRPRTCVDGAIENRRWDTVRFIEGNKNFILCEKCGGPYSIKLKSCSWHCEDCWSCSNRKGWSALCKKCTRANGRTRPMKYAGGGSVVIVRREIVAATSRSYSGVGYLHSYVGSSVEAHTSGRPDYTPARSTSTSGSICPQCLGRKWSEFSAETCRCFASEREELPGNTRMMYDGY
jgi:hypothetical protein